MFEESVDSKLHEKLEGLLRDWVSLVRSNRSWMCEIGHIVSIFADQDRLEPPRLGLASTPSHRPPTARSGRPGHIVRAHRTADLDDRVVGRGSMPTVRVIAHVKED